MARIQVAEGSWEEQQRRALNMTLVVSLREAHDASPTTICWPDPQAYIADRTRRTLSASQAHQLPDVGNSPRLNHDNSHRPCDNRVHRQPRVGDGSAAQHDSPHRRAGDRDQGTQELEGALPAMTAGPAAAHVTRKAVAPPAATGLAVRRTEGTGTRARATAATGIETAHGETVIEPTRSSPSRTAPDELPFPISRASTARGEWLPR